MFSLSKNLKAEDNYKVMCEIIKSTLKEEKNIIANLSNISAILNFYIEDLNWVGFYIKENDELVLGPFQGKPACIRIKDGKGVCGTASYEKKIIVVNNVNEFKGHIACDSETNSEIVLPIYKEGKVYGVLDLDSPQLSRFSNLEKKYLEIIANYISEYLSCE